MRFEALNQLFKAFAQGGSFRNTCGRLAKFFSFRTARGRYLGEASSYGSIRVLSSSSVIQFSRSAHPRVRGSSVVKRVLKTLFAATKSNNIYLQWIHRLLLCGFEIFAGQSWISAVLDGKEVLAAIPQNGIFKCADTIYLVLLVYPKADHHGETGLPMTTIPSHFKPKVRIVAAIYENLKIAKLLWPSKKEEGESGTMVRFVPM